MAKNKLLNVIRNDRLGNTYKNRLIGSKESDLNKWAQVGDSGFMIWQSCSLYRHVQLPNCSC